MPGSTEVIQEYMIKLGYVVDQVSFKKMFAGLDKTSDKIFKVGMVTAGAVVAVEAAVAAFAYSMRKMYFEAELSDSTVKNMNALAFAGKQVGISSEAMGGAIHAVAQNLRLNPGLVAFAKSLGVEVKGRDVGDVMLDLVAATKSMPEYVGAQQMGMFGVDPDTYHQMRDHLDELIAERDKNLALQKSLGIDLDKQKQTMLAYSEGLDNLAEHAKALGVVVLTNLLPAFKWFNSELMKDMDWWSGVKLRSLDDAVKNLKALFTYEPVRLAHPERYGPDGKLKPEDQAKLDAMGRANIYQDHTLLPGEKEANEAFNARLKNRLTLGLLPGEAEAKTAFDERLKRRLTIGGAPANSPLQQAQAQMPPSNPDGSVSLANTSFGKLIARGEGNYNSVNLGQTEGYKSGTADLENMTIQDVMLAQQAHKFNAAGRYQITKDTLIGAANAMQLDLNAKFDSKMQDKIFEQYLAGSKRPALQKYLHGQSDDIDAAAKAAAQEWASVADPTTGKSAHEGVGNNKASISADEMRRALQESRESILDNTKLGDANQTKPNVSMNNNNTFNINGGNAKDVADEVELRQSRVYGDALRNLVGAQYA